ncbi:MAG: hypothetical protein KDB69_08030, partial [Acidimicrobiia bacterium]|nr:hypothetical protein [Acidimicrobiia bacterium]
AFALLFPTVIGLIGLSVGFRDGGDMGDFAASIVGSLLFLVAAPTAWVMAFPFIDVTRFTVILFGILTSAPLWWMLGVGLARRSDTWGLWIRRYLVSCILWTVTSIVVVALVATLVG